MCDLFSLLSYILLSVWTCEGKPKKDKKELLTKWTWTETQTHSFGGVNVPLAGLRQPKHFTLMEASLQKRERLWWTEKVSTEKLTGCEESQRQWEQAAITVGRLFQHRDRNSFCCELRRCAYLGMQALLRHSSSHILLTERIFLSIDHCEPHRSCGW